MADDQVKYSDLFESGIVEEINNMKTALQGVVSEITKAKTEANGFRGAMSGMGTATREQQQSVAADATAIDALNKKVKQLTDEETRLNAAIKKAQDEYNKLTEGKLRYKKLTMDEVAAVEKLRQALKGEAAEQMAAVQSIDMQSKSYNELYQTYNALKEALNKMTVSERENTEAGKMMVNRAKEIRDTLNNLQQQTGNYTLNVGNYMSAMNGLQMQTQQILREIPSAQNLSQFFLAISNNIPMFADALARYNQGLPEIKAKLAAVTAEIARQNAAMAAMNTQSAEYAAAQARLNELQRQQQQLQGTSVSGWRAILKAVGSWQTLLIAGLLLLRKLPDIIKKIKTAFDPVLGALSRMRKDMSDMNVAMASVQSEVIKQTSDEITKLDMVVSRLMAVERGTKEWKDGIAMVNDITKQNLDAVKATKAEIRKVTEEYKEQAIQIATNDIVAKKIAESRARRALINAALEAETIQGAVAMLGYKPDSKEAQEFAKEWDKYQKAKPRPYTPPSDEELFAVPRIESDLGVQQPQVVEKPEPGKYERERAENVAKKYAEDLMDEAIEAELEKLIKPVKPLKKERTPKERQRQPSGSFNNSYDDVTMADLLVQEANAMSDKGDTVLQTIQMWYDKRVAITNAAYEKEKETLAKEKKERLDSLTQNLNNAKVFESKYDALVAEVDKDPYLDEDGKKARKAELKRQLDEATELIASEKKQRENIDKYYKDREKIAERKQQNELADLDKQRTEKLFKEAERRFKARQDADKRRFDLEKHNSIERAKFDMEQEIASKQWQIDHAKELELSEAELAILKEEVEWLNKKYNQGNYNAKRGNTGNYSNIMDVLFGEKITNDQISALNSVFDQAKEALNSWMDARKAAADQAKELADDEVSAAENALNREIELRNQGYANDVALREKELADAKAAQKKAAEEQKKVAQEQVLLDAALQTSSMITASANIIKQFPNPLAWAPMLALMWGTFAYAKTKAYQASTKSIKFKEGGVMLLEGGSHESGHDVNLGIGPDGSNLRAEGGEYFAVINKRSSRKYGSQIPAVVNALNSGMFEDRYIKTSDAVGLLPQVIRADNGTAVDLSSLEGGVDALVKQGESRWSTEGEWRVMRYKNLTRRVRIS